MVPVDEGSGANIKKSLLYFSKIYWSKWCKYRRFYQVLWDTEKRAKKWKILIPFLEGGLGRVVYLGVLDYW